MNNKRKLQDILHSADSHTIEKIADKYISADDRTSQRIYEMCVQKMMTKKGENSGYTEVFTAEKHKRIIYIRIAWLFAACIAVIGGVFFVLRNVKAPVPEKNEEPPIFFNETTAASTVTSDSGTKITIKTTAAISPENTYNQRKTTTAQKQFATSENKNDKSENTSKTNNSTVKTTTKQNSEKNTTTTTAQNITPDSQKLETPDDGRMTMQQVMDFIKYYGEDMTWEDFEPYEHEDITPAIDVVYKVHGWIIPVYENGTHKYTLSVTGLTISGKPASVNFYKSTQTEQQTFIDIRYEDITEFLSEDYDLANAMSFTKNVDLIKSIEVSGTDSTHNAFLGRSEMKEIIPLIKNIELIKKEGSSSNMMYYDIDITVNDHFHHNIRIQYPYLIIDGSSYRAEETSLNALFDYAASIVESHRPSEQIDVNGVWCWHDDFIQSVDFRDITDSITIKQFPDLIFDWHGKTYSVIAYDSNGNEYGSASVRFSAYFADLNGDGYPELCSANMGESNSMTVFEASVWDIRNNQHYSLASPDEYSYYFYEENGELFVNKKEAAVGANYDSSKGEKGKIGFDGNSIVFVSVN